MPNANDATAAGPQAGSGHASGAGAGAASAPRPRRERLVRTAMLLAGLGAFGYLLVSAHVPCGFARMFHTPCPGCGSTRAMVALFAGDVGGLIRFNPFAPFMSALVGLLAAQALASVVATGTFARTGDGMIGRIVSRGVLVVAALQVLLWLARFAGYLGGPVPV